MKMGKMMVGICVVAGAAIVFVLWCCIRAGSVADKIEEAVHRKSRSIDRTDSK